MAIISNEILINSGQITLHKSSTVNCIFVNANTFFKIYQNSSIVITVQQRGDFLVGTVVRP